MAGQMQFFSVLSKNPRANLAAEECIEKLQTQLPGNPDVLFVFASPAYREEFLELQALLLQGLKPRHVLGCSASGIIGAGQEVESEPALALSAAILPGVEITSFYLTDQRLPGPDASPHAWEEVVGLRRQSTPQFVMIADPFMQAAEDLLVGLDYAYPGCVKVGGLASGTRAPLEGALFLERGLYREGCVGLAFSGNIELDSLVAQGCRPIGRVMTVQRCKRNQLQELDAGKPLEVLSSLFERADEKEKQLMSSALFLGIHMDPLKGLPALSGSFLIRNIMGRGADGESVIVGAPLRVGQAVQFHVRDATTAKEDLQQVLIHYSKKKQIGVPAGALLFSCLGRGEQLFGQADHDSRLFNSVLGPLPLAGFFCNGEIGPVGGQTHLHGFTSSFGLFRPKLGYRTQKTGDRR